MQEQVHTGQFLVLSTLDHFSRKAVTVASGLKLVSGTVVALDGGLVKEFDNAVSSVDTTTETGTGENTPSVMVELAIGDHIVDGTLLVWKSGVNASEQAAAILAMKAVGTHVLNV
jgi:hypothetical protein